MYMGDSAHNDNVFTVISTSIPPYISSLIFWNKEMKKVYNKVEKVMEIVVEQRLILTHAFNYSFSGIYFGVSFSTCLLHMLPSPP